MEQTSIPNAPQPEETFVSNYVMIARLGGEPDLERLRLALDRLRPRHPLLVPAEAGFPLHIIAGCTDEDWREVVQAELGRGFPRSGPFARFVLLRTGGGTDLLGTFFHGVSDGLTGVYVFRDLLRLLGDPTLDLPPLPLPPEIMEILPAGVTANPRLKRRVGRAVAAFRLGRFFKHLRRKPAAWPPTAPDPASRRYRILIKTLDADRTAALVARCRAEGTSVHAALCTAWLQALAGELPGRSSWVRSASSPVSLRERLAQPIPENAGMYLSSVETRINCSTRRGFWEIARDFKRRLARGSADERIFFQTLLIHAFFSRFKEKDIPEVIETLFHGPVRYDFSITNLGRLDLPLQAGSLRLEAFYNLVNSSEHERTVGINTLDGRMTISLMCRESRMTAGEAETLMERALSLLARAAQSRQRSRQRS